MFHMFEHCFALAARLFLRRPKLPDLPILLPCTRAGGRLQAVAG